MVVEIFHSIVHNLSLDLKVEWKTVMYMHLSMLQLSCSTLKYALFSTLLVKKLCYTGFVAQNFPLICPRKVLHIIIII